MDQGCLTTAGRKKVIASKRGHRGGVRKNLKMSLSSGGHDKISRKHRCQDPFLLPNVDFVEITMLGGKR